MGAGIAVAVLSLDDKLTATLSEVVTADHTIGIAPDVVSLAEQVVATGAGVVLIDADAVSDDIVEALRRLRSQFPDLILVAAGNSAHQSRLANMIADGSVYRFLHKPVSNQRVRLFVDASLRRYDELRGAAAEIRKAQAAVAASKAAAPRIPPRVLLGGGAALALLAALLWWGMGGRKAALPVSVSTPAAAATDTANNSLGAAQEKQLAALLDRADKALQANKLDEASALLAAAARIQADNARLTFLVAQVSKAHERAALSQARSAAASGDYNKAFATLDAASSNDPTALSEARRALNQQKDDERLRALLRLGEERLTTGAVLEPANDSARYYAQSARAIAPRDTGTQRLLNAIQDRLLQDARTAATRGDSATTERLLGIAREQGARGSDAEPVRRVLGEARAAQKSAEISRVAASVRQRIAQDRLLEPAEDSAQFWLGKLRDLDAGNAAVVETSQLLGEKLLGKARAALASDDFDATTRWLRAADATAGRSADSAALAAELALRQEKLRRDKAVVGVSALKRIRFIEPSYPAAAETQKISGWVDMEFTVLKDGSVADIQIFNAQPGGMFDDAARSAVAKWRFAPVTRDGVVVEQRAKMRLRFNAPP